MGTCGLVGVWRGKWLKWCAASIAIAARRCYIGRMTLPFALPDGLPSWVIGLGIAVGALYLLVLLAMPFSVFGVKARLEGIEARLEEIQEDLRVIALRLPEGGGSAPPIAPRFAQEGAPEPRRFAKEEAPEARRPVPPERPARAEPRLNWPR